jgi:hypothetical protein
MEDLEIIELNDSSWSNGKSAQKSSNFGDGIELLMNEKKKDGPVSDINIDDLNSLEHELNSLVDSTSSAPSKSSTSSPFLFSESSSSSSSNNNTHNVRFSEAPSSSGPTNTSKQWDGYDNIKNIPIDQSAQENIKMTKEELLREKFKFLRKLETLETKGVNLTKKYSMESPLAEMQGEYEMIMEEKSKQNSIKFQSNMLMAVINGIEFLNNKFDPFDIKLDGWSDQINENLTDYDDVFAELFEKYKSKASMAPELKLLFQLGGSAMMVHMTNTMFKSAMPGMDDILRQNPDLMRQFQSAAVNSMGQTNPGLSGFMGGLMADQGQSRGPPPPLATQTTGPDIYSRPGNNSYGSGIQMGKNNFSDGDGIKFNVKDTNVSQQKSSRRPEMNGPSDINDILSGLKTKTINIQKPAAAEDVGGSTISLSDMKELQSEGNQLKRSGRRKKSDKNTMSLDI